MTPAETPTVCEACESFHHKGDDRSTWPEVFAEHHALIASKDARIRELVGALWRMLLVAKVHGCKGDGCCDYTVSARAALARSEGGSK